MWSYKTGGSINSSPAQGVDGRVCIGSDDNVLHTYSSTGKLGWSYRTAANISSSPAFDSAENVYVGSEDSRFYAFSSVGALEWSYQHMDDGLQDYWVSSPLIDAAGKAYMQARKRFVAFSSIGALEWSYYLGAPGVAYSSSPAMGSDGRIYLGAGDLDILYAINSNRSFAWSYRTGGTLEASPAIASDGSIYIGCYDNKIYAVASAGALAWSYLTAGEVYSSPAIDTSGIVCVGSRDNHLYAITSAGGLSWSYATMGKNIDSSPAIDVDGRVYAGAQDSMLYALNANGTLAWTYEAGESINSSPAIGMGSRLFVGSNDNYLYVLGKSSITYTLYADEDPGLENWMAVPFDGTGIDATVELGNEIADLFTFEADDSIVIERKIGSTQDSETTVGTYNGAEWGWNPPGGYSIVIGAMYKVTIKLAAGYDYGDLTITGCYYSTVQFDLYDLSGDDDNENWISVPFSIGNPATTVEIGESIAEEIEIETDDTLTIAVWDVATQAENTTVGTYNGAEWGWNPPEGYDVWPGMPIIVRPWRDGGMPTITWP